MIFASKILILIGIFLLIFGSFLLFQRYNPHRLEFQNFHSQRRVYSKVYPERLIISSIHVDLPIISSTIINNTWEATTNGVSYLSSSPNPGTQGNSILYGHNWTSILGNLPKIKPEQKILIVMSDGEQKIFTVKFISIVTPDQSNILSPSEDRRITLYTCTGFLDSKRFIVTAVLES